MQKQFFAIDIHVSATALLTVEENSYENATYGVQWNRPTLGSFKTLGNILSRFLNKPSTLLNTFDIPWGFQTNLLSCFINSFWHFIASVCCRLTKNAWQQCQCICWLPSNLTSSLYPHRTQLPLCKPHNLPIATFLLHKMFKFCSMSNLFGCHQDLLSELWD